MISPTDKGRFKNIDANYFDVGEISMSARKRSYTAAIRKPVGRKWSTFETLEKDRWCNCKEGFESIGRARSFDVERRNTERRANNALLPRSPYMRAVHTGRHSQIIFISYYCARLRVAYDVIRCVVYVSACCCWKAHSARNVKLKRHHDGRCRTTKTWREIVILASPQLLH